MPTRLIVIALLIFQVSAQGAATPSSFFPDPEWQRVEPESVGYSSQRLEALRGWLKTQPTSAMLVIVGGRIVFEYGDLEQVNNVASIRKSVLAMLYGKYHAQGQIDLSRTVVQLGLDDVQPFLPVEREATLLHLLTARSGIYHPSSTQRLTDASPRRGSKAPGSYFQYQNWDFDAAGTAFEKLTGRGIYEALKSDLADPIGMQDFAISDQAKTSSMPRSIHPQYPMNLSARDMARLGLLMLRQGNWDGKQLLPSDWTRFLTTLVTPAREINVGDQQLDPFRVGRWGYGVLWWVWDAPVSAARSGDAFQGAYAAMGSRAQRIAVLPALDAVIVHRVFGPTDLAGDDLQTILQMVVGSRCRRDCSN